MSPTLQLLRELIARPSVNPAFLVGHPEWTGEQRVGTFLADRARKAGLEVSLSRVLPQRENVIVRLAPTGRVRQRVLFAPHLDTVGGAEVPGKLFRPELRSGRLYGRGACDTKGSVAAFFQAVLAVARSGARPKSTEISFVGLIDEESGQAGSRALVKNGFRADLAIVGEPTELSVVTAHKGDVWLEITTRGRAAHGARPELGCNAVHRMAGVVETIETEYARALRAGRRHPQLGRATVNVGTIAGGRQPNIVPDACVITVDRRTLPGESEASVKRELRALFRRRGLLAEIAEFRGAPAWPMETDPADPWVRIFLQAAKQKKPTGVDYFTDAGVLRHGGIPSIVFGPGNIAQAHTAEEWISVRQLEQAQQITERFLRSLP